MKVFKKNSGMTLIELMVSIGIMVMILAAIFGFYSAGIKSWLISENQMDVQQNARTAFDWICRDLKVAREYEILSQQSLSITPYKGDKTIYQKVGKQLIMEKNGNQAPVADYIDDLRFEQMPGGIVKIDLIVENNSYEVKLSTKIEPPAPEKALKKEAL
ncbi:MAG: PilW family protein, partial [Tepidanaerobacteraceae bacterium]|jgi:prepilin-type N-terminal cleavage/methylation domain-containing protein